MNIVETYIYRSKAYSFVIQNFSIWITVAHMTLYMYSESILRTLLICTKHSLTCYWMRYGEQHPRAAFIQCQPHSVTSPPSPGQHSFGTTTELVATAIKYGHHTPTKCHTPLYTTGKNCAKRMSQNTVFEWESQ